MGQTEPGGDPFEALGDRNRRAIVELLGSGGRTVRQIADALPISRPAVSRHLRLLKDAGLVIDQPRGTRRIYQLHDQGVEAVRAYLAEVWGDAAARFRILAENIKPSGGEAMIEPLRMSFEVDCPAQHAFEVWTARTSRWWPVAHTVTAEAGLQVVFEGRLGGRIFERTPAGVEVDWGEITLWEPPQRLGYLWHIRADRADATEVEIRFTDQGDATTRVDIEHRGWERLGARGPGWRDANRGGWDGLLPHFRAACSSAELRERQA